MGEMTPEVALCIGAGMIFMCIGVLHASWCLVQ